MRYAPGRRLAEWYRTITQGTGEMTSRELLVIIAGFPDDSPYMRAASAPWSRRERLAAEAVNILHGVREDYRSVHDAPYDYSPHEMPELGHVRQAREAEEAKRQSAYRAKEDLMQGLLSGAIRMADITPQMWEEMN